MHRGAAHVIGVTYPDHGEIRYICMDNRVLGFYILDQKKYKTKIKQDAEENGLLDFHIEKCIDRPIELPSITQFTSQLRETPLTGFNLALSILLIEEEQTQPI